MAEIRAGDWGTEEFWLERVRAYLREESHPAFGLSPRAGFVCCDGEHIVGLIAGHLTTRFGCEGELQWISVRPECRGRGAASRLFRLLAEWFIDHQARRICVDVEPSNSVARAFYRSMGAREFKPYWMIWNDIGAALAEERSAHSPGG
jgi:ribosomal protein S18 acetylase RimI-like enzyme